MPADIANLQKSIKFGAVEAPSLFLMAPLTRCRAEMPGHLATKAMAQHYADRASAGLLIAEATMVAEGHSGFCTEPGIYNDAQVAAWKQVTDAVHAKKGRIFLQIWHAGRAAHSVNDGKEPVSASALAIGGHGMGPEFNSKREKIAYEVPHALAEEELPAIVNLFVTAAKNAMTAGFDGVEVHSANGYLLDQFLRDSANKRTDKFGGSIENRCRFPLQVLDAVCAAIGSDHVGIRMSPLNSFNGMIDSDPEALTRFYASECSKRKLSYFHIMRADFFQAQKGEAVKWVRESFEGNVVANMGYEVEEAEAAIKSGQVDAIAFGTKFLANPDFVERAAVGAEFNAMKPEHFYTHGHEGYNDYPAMKA